MADDIVYSTKVGRYADGDRQYWQLVPCSGDALSTPAQVTLPAGFLSGGPKKSFKHDNLAYGFGSIETMKQKVELWTVEGTTLYDYLTGSGVEIVYGITANMVWTLRSDRGNASLDPEDFHVEFQGLQLAQVGMEGSFDPFSIELELVHITTALLQAVTITTWGTQLKGLVAAVGGDGSTTGYARNRLYNTAYQDTNSRTYAAMERNAGSGSAGDEVVMVRFVDCWDVLENAIEHGYQLLVRQGGASFAFTSTNAGSGANHPWAFTSQWKLSYTNAGGKGGSLDFGDRYWAPFIRSNGDTSGVTLGGVLDGDRGPWKEYENLLAFLKDATESGSSKAEYLLGLTGGGTYAAAIKWSKLVDDTTTVAAGSMPAKKRYQEKQAKWKRAGGIVGGCTGKIVGAVGNDLKEIPNPIAGLGSVQPYSLRFPLHTMPAAHTDKTHYWVRAGSLATAESVADVDFDQSGDLDDKAIVGATGFVTNRWFYLERNAANGGPAFIDGSVDRLPFRVHHTTEYDFGAVAGSYNDASPAVAMPTLAVGSLAASEYDAWLLLLLGTFRSMQQKSDVGVLSSAIARIFSSRDQMTITVSVLRPNAYSRNPVNSLFTFAPTDLRPGFMEDQLSEKTMIVSIDQNPAEGVDLVTLFTLPTAV